MFLRTLTAAVALTLVAAGCTSDKPEEAPDPSVTEGDSSKLVEISPLTGQTLKKGRPDNPVFVVKIENTFGGEPQINLDKADLVIEELVEGGLTRLAALYYSELPDTVGHVRSMRVTDIGIATPVGGQIVASGGAGGTNSRVASAGIPVFSEDAGAPGFSSDPAKVRPYNRLVNLKTLAKEAKPSKILGPYLSWAPAGEKVKPKGKKATKATVRFSRNTATSWTFGGGTWSRTNGHAPSGSDFDADTMIVLFCDIGDAGYTDPAGNPVPTTEFEGSGRAVIFHGGRAQEATWSKKNLGSTVKFEAKNGSPIEIEPGNVWLELAPKGDGSVSLG